MMREIEEFVARVAREFRPQRVILFGSHAYGRPTADSDVDLLVVTQHQGKGWEAATQIRCRVDPPFPLDLLVRSPEHLSERLALGDPFFREVVQRGKVLYEADHE